MTARAAVLAFAMAAVAEAVVLGFLAWLAWRG